jgi:putative polymerase
MSVAPITSPALRLPRTPAALAAPQISPAVATILVLGATTFNMGLCFANTNVMAISDMHVILCEFVILSLTFLAVYRSVSNAHLILLGFIAIWPMLLASVRFITGNDSTIDVKIVRDLAIPIGFFLLGTASPNLKTADRIVTAALVIVLIVALFEYFWIEMFTKFFNIAKYYIARGTLEAKQIWQNSDLFISGTRPGGGGDGGGRNLLPFLGDHRVSSVFLEPVSAGNFGVIAFLWGMVRSRMEQKLYLGTMTVAMVLIVLGDSRFGAYLCIIALVVSFFPIAWTTMGAIFMPLISLAVLVLVPLIVTGSYDPQNRYIDNGFVGRFVLSARILGEFDLLTWFGLKAPSMQAFDSGYAYAISRVGVIGLAVLWLIPFSLKNPDRNFCLFRNLMAIYYGAIFCVSNSAFTIKTAALAWFLFGVIYQATAVRSALVRLAQLAQAWFRANGGRAAQAHRTS